MMSQESLPAQDDVQSSGPSEQELLDAVMKSSPIMDSVPLPEEQVSEEDPVEPVPEDDQETAEAVSEEVEEEVEVPEEETEGEDDTSTQEPEVFTAETLDLDAKVAVKIDGQEQEVSFGDLIKGYSTEQSLSNKGRELGEARKQLDEEKSKALEEVNKVGQIANATLQSSEQGFAKQYHDVEEKIEKARKEGDDYELGKLKDQREQIQKNYWTVRNRREQIAKQIEEQNQKAVQEDWDRQLKHFNDTIPTLIPDFSEDVAQNIRKFAMDEGINPEVLDTITDPSIVKFVDDYRRLKQGVTKGAAKRKVVPAKKAPAKKPTSPQKKQQNKEAMVKARAFKDDASRDDQMDYLKQLASRTLNNL